MGRNDNQMNCGIDSFVMDLKSIPLLETEKEPSIVRIQEADGFFINPSYSQDFRIRRSVYQKIIEARKLLPSGLNFCFYEAYRPLSRQIELWKNIQSEIRSRYPDMQGEDFIHLCENFIANPYDGIGSGHQAACAIDVTLCDSHGGEIDMGTEMHEFNKQTKTDAGGIGYEQKRNRRILSDALHAVEFQNYPAEWWHFSYGDHQWAWLAKAEHAIYGPIDI